MTVSEMMAILSDMPADARVYFWVDVGDEEFPNEQECRDPIFRAKYTVNDPSETSVHFEHD